MYENILWPAILKLFARFYNHWQTIEKITRHLKHQMRRYKTAFARLIPPYTRVVAECF